MAGASAGCAAVWSSKAHGAWLLHEHSVDDGLKYFVVFSSIAAAIGNVGQSAYSASNSYLDGLVEHRVQRGLAGLSIRWPAVSGIGMAAAAAVDVEGISITPSEAERILQESFVMRSGVEAVRTILPSGVGGWLKKGLLMQFEGVVAAAAASSSSSSSSSSAARLVARSAGGDRASRKKNKKSRQTERSVSEVSGMVRSIVESLVDSSDIADDAQVMELGGFDSLSATELSGKLSSEFGVRVSPTMVFNYPTLRDITSHLLDLLGLSEAEDVPSPRSVSTRGGGGGARLGGRHRHRGCELPPAWRRE